MRRLPAFLLILVMTPSLGEAQATDRSHTVVQGETLWGLAERYCSDPFKWPEIFQANQSQITDPNEIVPDQVLAISCAPGGVTGVAIVTPAGSTEVTGEPAPPFDERSRPSVFRRDMSGTVGLAAAPVLSVMSREVSWSAPWLNVGVEEPWSAGHIVSLLAGEFSRTAMPYQRVRVASEDRPALGDIYQIFRHKRLIEGLGTVLVPTGMLSVTSVATGGFEAVVLSTYGRVVTGAFVIPAPPFDLQPGDESTPVSSDATALILAFGEPHVIKQMGDIALLDKGSVDGVSLGDEYVLVTENEDGWEGSVAGRLQVVRVSEETSSARIIQIKRPEFAAQLVVRLDRKMR